MRWDAGRDLADLADLAGVRAATLQPHRQEKWKLSADPQFVAKVKAIVGLYLNPPERAVVVPWHITAGLFGRVRILACQTSLMRSRLTAVALAAGLAGLYCTLLRGPVEPGLAARVGVVPMEAGSLVMERKMLRGIKQRAERLASVTPEHFGGQIA